MVARMAGTKKIVETGRYVIIFNVVNGKEIIFGKHGFPDPFMLDYPNLIDIGIMGHCPNKCKFCYQGSHEQPNMKLKDFKRIIDESKAYTNQIALGGRGDPNLHENFGEIVGYARENVVVPNYTTSGLGLTSEHIEISKMCGAVAVSDYGQEFTFGALQKLMDSDIKTNLHFLLSKESLGKAVNILKGEDVWGGKIDLDRLNAVIFLLFKPQGRGKKLKDWALTNEDLKEFIDLRLEGNANFKIGMDSCLVNRITQTTTLSKMEEMFLDTCEAARMSCYITPDMILMPCSFADRDKYGVSLENMSIEDAWKLSRAFTKTRQLLEINKERCPYGF